MEGMVAGSPDEAGSAASRRSSASILSGDRRSSASHGPQDPAHALPERLAGLWAVVRASPQPMLLWWGPDLAQFHNDAWEALVGAAGGHEPVHARKTWAHGWHLLEQAIDEVRSGRSVRTREILWCAHEGEHRREMFSTLSLSPIRVDPDEEVAVLAICTDVTECKLHQRRARMLRRLSRLGCASTRDAAWSEALHVLGSDTYDIPFALVYRIEREERHARLVATTGIEPGSRAAPRWLSFDETHAWPLRRVVTRPQRFAMRDLDHALGRLPGGPWPESAREAMVLPLCEGGDSPLGVLIVGCSPRRRLDAGFETHAELVARQVERVGLLSEEVTHSLHTQQRIQQVQRQAEAASRAKDEFLAMLGHELRNPLAPIVTALEIMRTHPDVYSREREVIERQVAHLRRLVDDLLDVSRVIRGKLDAAMTPVPVQDVIERALEMASPLVEARAQPLHVEVGDDLWVRGDALRLAQVVANLLTNASKYSKKWRPITVRAVRDRDELMIAVIDEGIGIPAEMLSRLFEPFVQLRRRQGRGPEGLGLGLALVRGLTELHGGRVRASSDGPGQGSRFEVRLPLLLDRPLPTEDPMPSRAPPYDGPPRRILVVDDNEDAAEMLATILRARGHQVEVALDGPQALSIAERFEPEVGVLDIGLPVMDGYALCRALRERNGGADMLIVAVTGYGRLRDRVEALGSGFDDHLVKPVDVDDLLERMARYRCGVIRTPRHEDR